jgi:hypothetical protein
VEASRARAAALAARDPIGCVATSTSAIMAMINDHTSSYSRPVTSGPPPGFGAPPPLESRMLEQAHDSMQAADARWQTHQQSQQLLQSQPWQTPHTSTFLTADDQAPQAQYQHQQPEGEEEVKEEEEEEEEEEPASATTPYLKMLMSPKPPPKTKQAAFFKDDGGGGSGGSGGSGYDDGYWYAAGGPAGRGGGGSGGSGFGIPPEDKGSGPRLYIGMDSIVHFLRCFISCYH